MYFCTENSLDAFFIGIKGNVDFLTTSSMILEIYCHCDAHLWFIVTGRIAKLCGLNFLTMDLEDKFLARGKYLIFISAMCSSRGCLCLNPFLLLFLNALQHMRLFVGASVPTYVTPVFLLWFYFKYCDNSFCAIEKISLNKSGTRH